MATLPQDREFCLNNDDNVSENSDNLFCISSDCSQTSKYITEGEVNNFMCFDVTTAINLLHINCRSLKKNFNSFSTFINGFLNPLLAIGVTETWLNESHDDIYSLHGYNFISKPRINKSGGGVGLYVNNQIDFIIKQELCLTESYIECLFVEIVQADKRNILIGCIYRPPNTDLGLFNNYISSVLSVIDKGNNKLAFILGDFNLDLLKFNVHAPTGEFINTMMSHSYFPLITYPTRISDSSATLIDNIFVNTNKFPCKSAIIYNDISDHLPVVAHVEVNFKKNFKLPTTFVKRCINNESLALFNLHLQHNGVWDEVYQSLHNSSDPSAAYDCFFKIYNNVFNIYFPQRELKLSHKMTPRKEWITKGLMKSCIRKSNLYKKYCKFKTNDNKIRYVKYRNKLKVLLHKSERDFYAAKFHMLSGKIRETWKLLGSILKGGKHDDICNIFLINGNLVNDKNVIVDKFNEYFVSLGSNLASLIPATSTTFSSFLKEPNLRSFSLYLTDAHEVTELASKFPNKSSAGYDGIPLNILKSSIRFIAEPISQIINCSFSTGIFPDKLKIAKVCPIFKNGEKNLLSNYRPISILPSFSKIFEKLVATRLLSFLDSSNLIAKCQYGFRKNYSSYMALLDVYDKISSALDAGELPIGVFIDLSKAFDTLNHSILIAKLEYYGVRGIALQWFTHYLQSRQQYVFYNNATSTLRSIDCGVPQGSILGPLLFILYINDIENCSDLFKFVLFADDTNLFYSSDNADHFVEQVNYELCKLSTWFQANKLSLNVKKTNFILFGNRHIRTSTPISLYIEGVPLEQVQFTKFLGVFLDRQLRWTEHFNYISLKISRGLGMINRVKFLVPKESLKTLYYTMIYPYLSYCCIVWGGACSVALHRLEILQNRAVRLITHSHYRLSTGPLFQHLKLLKLSDIHKMSVLLYMYKCKNSLLPVYSKQYCFVNVSRPYPTRHFSYFAFCFCRTMVREKCIAILGPKLWDSLPLHLQESFTLCAFKRDIRCYFFSQY